MYDVVENLPENIEIYLVGGALRNAYVYKYHGEQWLQRDYDQIVISGSEEYLTYLESKGFKKGGMDKPTQRIMVKALKEDGAEISYVDNLVFDIHMVDGTTVEDNLAHDTGLLINGFAVNMRDIFKNDCLDRVISLDGAEQCIQDKQIKINQIGYRAEANHFFACLRFMGAGFKAPPKSEAIQLLLELPRMESERYQRNLQKLKDYVGGEGKAKSLVEAAIGPGIDIFDEQDAKKMINHLARS